MLETKGIQFRGVSVLWAVPFAHPKSAKDIASSV
jgi:hypothetical protein